MTNHQIDAYSKKIKKDFLHWNCRRMDSYRKTWNFTVSAREPGKSTKFDWKLYQNFVHRHERCLIVRRRPVDMTEGYVRSIASTINKFLPVHKRIQFYFNKGDLNRGQCDLYLDAKRTKLFGRVQALNIPSERAKSNFIPNVSSILYDEFIPNDTHAYLPKEVQNFLDVYSTYYREFKGHLRCYFSGNPYTIFNPFFSYLNIPINEIKPGAFLVGEDYILDFPVISKELREYILSKNPLYKFDSEYTQYALNGIALNDAKYQINSNKPRHYKLKYVFRAGGMFIYVWKQPDFSIYGGFDHSCKYWIEARKKPLKTGKKTYAVDFDNLVQDTTLVTTGIKSITSGLKNAVASRKVTYASVDAAVLMENIYSVI